MISNVNKQRAQILSMVKKYKQGHKVQWMSGPAGKSYEIPVDELIIHPGTPRKSVLGNNGTFDRNINDIFRVLGPIGIGISTHKKNK